MVSSALRHAYVGLSFLAVGTHAAPSGSKVVIAQMFQWSWASIAAECTAFLGPAGYGFVQVSPPAEHVTGTAWWTDYQPVSYTLTSKRGNRSQFQSMISTCHAAGVKVIVDTLWNHMAGSDSGTGVAGSTFTHYNYPGIYQTQDFHHCGLEPNDDIVSYTNRVEVQTCELDNLADLATETEYVRGRLAQYGNDLLSLGADGFRLDAAKHIAASDIANITSRLTLKPYITQEVYTVIGQPVVATEYTGNGDAQEFQYTSALMTAFQSGGISTLSDVGSRSGWLASGSANVFVANHDTERSGTSLTYNATSNMYTLATVFTLGFPYGTPTVLSGYSFVLPSGKDSGSPNSGAGTCSGSGGSNGWLCQHRWTAIAGMVGFRNTVGTTALNNWVVGTTQQVAFGRGSVGYLIINNGDAAWARTFQTPLPAGSYCDVITGATVSGGGCSGSWYTVAADGTFTTTVPARSAVGLHTGAKGSGSTITFAVDATTTFGDNIFVTGSLAALSGWSTGSSIPLSAATYPIWKASVNVGANVSFQYKYVRKTSSGGIVWESDPNRSATSGAIGQTVELDDTWR